MPVLMKLNIVSYILQPNSFPQWVEFFSNTVEITSPGKQMEVGLVVSPDPDASPPELLGPADPGAAS